jgi:hypothetical protein
MGEWRCSYNVLNLGNKKRWVVSFTLLSFNLGRRAPGTHRIKGWAGPRIGLDALRKRKKSYTTSTDTAADTFDTQSTDTADKQLLTADTQLLTPLIHSCRQPIHNYWHRWYTATDSRYTATDTADTQLLIQLIHSCWCCYTVRCQGLLIV